MMLTILTVLSSLLPVFLSQTCDQVTFSAKTLIQDNLGTFSLSTGRCQALKITLDQYNLKLENSIMFDCDSNDLNTFIFSDAYCQKQSDHLHLKEDGKIKIFNGLVTLTLDSISCDASDECFLDLSFGNNCTWGSGDTYFNVSFPLDECMSLDGSIQQGSEDGGNINGASLRFDCCKKDESLLLFNYSDKACGVEDGVIRIDSKYNGACFKVLRNGEEDVNDRRRFLSFYRHLLQETPEEEQHQDGVFELQWQCSSDKNDLIDCNSLGYNLISDDLYPPLCYDTCLNDNKWSKDDLSPNDGKDDSGKGGKDGGNSGNKKDNNAYIITFIVGFIAILLVLISVYFYSKYKKLKEETNPKGEVKFDQEKYEPMIEESDIVVDNLNKSNGQQKDIVLPPKEEENNENIQETENTNNETIVNEEINESVN